MRKISLFFLALVLFFAGTFWVSGCKSDSDGTSKAEIKSTLLRFREVVAAIKEEIGAKDPTIGIYFQRVWQPTERIDSCSVHPETFIGEFFSSHRQIVYSVPTIFLETFYMNNDPAIPENIMFIPEEKTGDTLFFYSEHNHGFMAQDQEQLARPIACVTSDGEVIVLGEYLISREYAEKKIVAFLNEIIEKHQQHQS